MSSKVSKMKGLLPKGFKPDKCKASIRMALARMNVMRNKRDVQVKQVRREVAQLLQSGQESTARIRVDHVIRDEKTIQAYELLEVYCELIIQRLHIIDSQKICPIDLKEAIATIVFAAPRCADVPELSDVIKHFQAKYGKEFINSALELRPGSGVSQLVVDKLSASSANIETKVKVLKSIAEENNVKWEAKGFEEEKQVPGLARLDGSSKFLKVSEMETVQSVPVQTPPPVTTYQPQNYAHQNSGAYQPARPNNSSGISDSSHATSVQVYRSQSGSRNKESKYVSEEENIKTPPDLSDHNEEFATVEEAAEAAAKSAEIASKAAKAAAAMARHSGLSREQSNVSSKSYSSRDSPRKYDMEESSSKPETPSSFSVQTSTMHAGGPQIGQFKPPPDRSSVAPPSPSPSHSSASSSGYDEVYNVTPNIDTRKSREYHKEIKVEQEDEYGYPGITTRYNNSNRQGSTSLQEDAIWDDNGDEEQPEVVSSNKRSNSSGVAFNDSRLEMYDRPVYEEEQPKVVSSNKRSNSSGVAFNDSRLEMYDRPVYEEEQPKIVSSNKRSNSSGVAFNDSRLEMYERSDSSASRRGTAWFSSDNISSPQLPKSSVHMNSSSLPYISNTSERDPPRSPANMGSGSQFDKGPKSTSSSLFNDDGSNLLSILSGRSPPRSYAEEDFGPKFDSGPNFDADVLSDDENDKVNPGHMHVEEEKVIEKEYSSSLSPLLHAKESTKDTFTSSSDESGTKKLPESLRTRNSRTKHAEPVLPKIMKEPSVETEKAPYIRQESSDDNDDSGKQQFLNYNNLIPGSRNKSGSKRTPYTVKTLVEESKPAIRKYEVDLSVEEEQLYTPNHSNDRESEGRRNSPLRDAPLGHKLSDRKKASGSGALRYTPNRWNFGEEEETEQSQPTKIQLKVPSSSRMSGYVALEDEEAEEEVAKQTKIKLKGSGSSKVSKGYLSASENQLDYQEQLKINRRVVGSSSRDSLEVKKEAAPMVKIKEAPSKSSENRRPLRYVPTREDSDEEEQVRTVQPEERTTPSTIDVQKEKVELKEKKEETASAQPTFARASFPLDMDALRARVQQIRATMNNP